MSSVGGARSFRLTRLINCFGRTRSSKVTKLYTPHELHCIAIHHLHLQHGGRKMRRWREERKHTREVLGN